MAQSGVTDAMVKDAAAVIENELSYRGFPNTRMPGTESIDCEEIARLVLETAFRKIAWDAAKRGRF